MRLALLLSFVLALGSTAAVADHHEKAGAHGQHGQQDPKQQEMMKKWHAYATPGDAHKVLAGMAGSWTYKSKMWHVKDGQPEESKGTAFMKMVLGGRYLQQDFKGKAMGMAFHGMGLVGFNNQTKKYETVWIDNMGTGMTRSTGEYDPATKILKEKGKFSCPEKDDAEFKSEWTITDKNNMVYTMWGPDMNGDEIKMMEITYKRAK